jgi:dienelactone hydrolase
MNQSEDFTEAEDLRLATEMKKIPYHAGNEEDPYIITDLFHAREEQNAMEIPVEKITSPLLIISGGQDQIWPSALYAKKIQKRLAQSTLKHQFLNFPEAGHGIIAPYEGPVYHPIGNFWCTLGGDSKANAEANKKAWEEVATFLRS